MNSFKMKAFSEDDKNSGLRAAHKKSENLRMFIKNKEMKYDSLLQKYNELDRQYNELFEQHTKLLESSPSAESALQKQGEQEASSADKKKKNAFAQISSAIVLGLLIATVLMLLIKPDEELGANIFGYSYYNILSGSMQSELPKGSFVLVKETSSDAIKKGDNITFLKDSKTVATHKVVEIIKDFDDSGGYGFRTQGTENPEPDSDIVYESNVIGVVVFSIPNLGFILSYIGQNVWLLFVFFALFSVLVTSLRIAIKQDKKTKEVEREI